MSWTEIKNHRSILDRFRQAVRRNRLASTYLFVGPEGVGKRAFALKLAESLLCENRAEEDLEPCGQCAACTQVLSGNHPDLIQVSKPENKNTIPVEFFIGDREHRRQEGLCHDIGLKPFRGGRKIAIIDDADYLNQESANSLLKTLEEPPPSSLLILIGTSAERQLQTIVSRSQVVRFGPLTADEVEKLLREKNLVDEDSPTNIAQIAAACNGSLDLAMKLADVDTFEFRKDLFRQLATLDPGRGNFIKSLTAFVDGAGKDAAAKRTRLHMVADFAIDFYQHLMTERTGGDSELDAQVNTARRNLNLGGGNQQSRVAAECISRSIELQRHVAANANAANSVAVWLRDLGRICRGQFVESVSMV